ncbi:RNA polymerase subunit sigma-70 [Pseudactinotalea suaedae]|uniref:RNA polymerase subunit sigma-70 n=1 Tax=Pseudactinotalea suaedae TaxID=1524924 RepID=UPI0012E1E278|nr:RNA polymerase subunit sigma-70 [Pseudactinotalea suaedae]
MSVLEEVEAPVPSTHLRTPGGAAGEEDFTALVGSHRRELLAHCYRMTGSLADAEELTQEAFLRAWRNRDGFRGAASARTWLYRIATNACLDFLKNHARRAQPSDSIVETLEHESGIDPFPDDDDPAAIVSQAETTDLYLTAALLHLPPRQRAAVVTRDLLDLDAVTSAAVLETTVTAVNSLLQRAHARLRELGARIEDVSAPAATGDEDEIVRAYVDAHHRGDVAGILALLSEDVRVSMPPEAPSRGLAQAEALFAHLLGPTGPGTWTLVSTRANGSPAVANYVQGPGDPEAHALSIDVLRVRDGRIAGIHCFLGAEAFAAFGLGLVPSAPEIDGGDRRRTDQDSTRW